MLSAVAEAIHRWVPQLLLLPRFQLAGRKSATQAKVLTGRHAEPRRRFVALAASFDAGAVSAEIKLNFAAGAIVNRVDFVDCLDASCWTSHRQNPFEDPGANSKIDSFWSVEIGGGVGSRATEKTLTLENASNGFESALKDILCKHLQTTTVTIKSHD